MPVNALGPGPLSNGEIQKLIEEAVRKSDTDTAEKLAGLREEVLNYRVNDDDFISVDRINEIANLPTDKFDFSRLIKLCQELNLNFRSGSYISSMAIVRAITAHICPVFDSNYADFGQVANCYSFGPSIKKVMKHLSDASYSNSNIEIHTRIGSNEQLPNKQMVTASQDGIDRLLSEVCKKILNG